MKIKMFVLLALLAVSMNAGAETVAEVQAERCNSLQRLATTIHLKRMEGVSKHTALEVIENHNDGTGGESLRSAKKAASAVAELVYLDYSAQEIGDMCRK